MDNTASYKNLIVYQKSRLLTIDILNSSYDAKSKKFEFVINQLFRAVSSICANLVEGYGRFYKKELRHFLAIARGSSFETDYWLEIVLQLQIFDNNKTQNFIARNQEITKMLTTLMKKLEGSTKS